jgi:hypothetical protein
MAGAVSVAQDRDGEYEALLERLDPPLPSQLAEKRVWTWAPTEEHALAKIVDEHPGWRIRSIRRSLF